MNSAGRAPYSTPPAHHTALYRWLRRCSHRSQGPLAQPQPALIWLLALLTPSTLHIVFFLLHDRPSTSTISFSQKSAIYLASPLSNAAAVNGQFVLLARRRHSCRLRRRPCSVCFARPPQHRAAAAPNQNRGPKKIKSKKHIIVITAKLIRHTPQPHAAASIQLHFNAFLSLPSSIDTVPRGSFDVV